MVDDNTMQKYLAQHPRMIGVLFTMFVLLSQTGTVAAGMNTQVGP